MTKEQKRISKINYKKAAEYFNVQSGECLHHIDTSWLYEDIERYIQWNISDLVKLTISEHMKIHNTGENNYMYGKGYQITGEKNGMYDVHRYGELNPMWGKHMSEESKEKSSESHKGQVAWNKGKKGCYSEETRKKMSEAAKRRWTTV